MTTDHKIALGVGLVALAIGVPYLLQIKRLAQEIETVTKVNIHKINLAGIELRVDVTMKNPTGGSVKIKFPFVKMLYKDILIATSEVKDQDYSILKFGQKQLDPIFVSLPFMQLASSAPEMLKQYRKSGKLELEVKTISTINNKIPYSKTDLVSI